MNNECSTDSSNVINELLQKQYHRCLAKVPSAAASDWLAERSTGLRRSGTIVISLIGGAAAGKSTFAESLTTAFRQRNIPADTISTDSFVLGTREWRRTHVEGGDPRAKYDFAYLNVLVDKIRRNRNPEARIPVPTYDEGTGVAIAAGEENYTHRIGVLDYLIVEGDFDAVEHADLRVYLHVDDSVRLENRLRRDCQTRSEGDSAKIRDNFLLRQRLQHFPFTLPAAERADFIVVSKAESGGHICDLFEKKA